MPFHALRIVATAMVAYVATFGALVASGTPVQASLTNCNQQYYDYVQQWTANSSAFYRPGSCGPGSNRYYGWTGLDGNMETPSHFPNLAGSPNNHSVGWLDVSFSNGSWIQIGWLGGCGGIGSQSVCFNSGVGLYDEADNIITGFYTVQSDGAANYSYTDTYRIQYFRSSACWEVFNLYNQLLRSLCGTFPTSGGPTVGSETDNSHTPGSQVEMPYTYFGSSSPATNNGLRIQGAAGYVIWYATLSTGATSYYDESNCPNVNYCNGSPAYTYTSLGSSYYFSAHGYP